MYLFLKLFSYITKHLISAPSGNSEFCFPSTLNVSLDFVSGNIESLGKTKLTISLGSRIKCIIYTVVYFTSAKQTTNLFTVTGQYFTLYTYTVHFYFTNKESVFYLCTNSHLSSSLLRLIRSHSI